jgi:phage-related baseplate assembly protein
MTHQAISGQLGQADLAELAQAADAALGKLDFEAILLECKSALQAILQQHRGLSAIDVAALPESDPICKILELLAYREMLTRQRMREAMRACFLSTAIREDLLRLSALILSGREAAESIVDGETALRGRVIDEFHHIHTAGSRNAYIELARQAADPQVLDDVTVERRRRGVVGVTLLYTPDSAPAARAAAHAAIAARLGDEAVRPIGQQLIVDDAHIVPYRVRATLGIRDRLGAAETLAAARDAVLRYIDARYGFGRTVYRTAVLSALQRPGVDYIVLDGLKENPGVTDVVVGDDEAAWCPPEAVDLRLHLDVPNEKVAQVTPVSCTRKRDILSCVLVITPPPHEVRLTHYVLYWGNGDGRKLPGHASLASCPVGGERRLELRGAQIPEGARALLVYTANENGEMTDSDAAGGAFALTIPE